MYPLRLLVTSVVTANTIFADIFRHSCAPAIFLKQTIDTKFGIKFGTMFC